MRAAKDGAAGPVAAYAPMRRARGQARPERDGLGVRDRLGRRARAGAGRGRARPLRARRRRCARRAQRSELLDAHAARAAHERVRPRRRDLHVPRAAGRLRRAWTYIVFDVLEFEGAALLDTPWSSGTSSWAACSTTTSARCGSRAPTTTAQRCARPGARRASGSSRSDATRATARRRRQRRLAPAVLRGPEGLLSGFSAISRRRRRAAPAADLRSVPAWGIHSRL